MDEADMYVLNSVRADIVDNVDAKYIVDALIQSEVLTPDHDEEIKAEKTAKVHSQIHMSKCALVYNHIRLIQVICSTVHH